MSSLLGSFRAQKSKGKKSIGTGKGRELFSQDKDENLCIDNDETTDVAENDESSSVIDESLDPTNSQEIELDVVDEVENPSEGCKLESFRKSQNGEGNDNKKIH
ncbi:hypothetical protein FQR65_LT17051 [Abscondita terminalis]|nr:hypothetical protein FQR65_LT17051 [Abscondita terminalis]